MFSLRIEAAASCVACCVPSVRPSIMPPFTACCPALLKILLAVEPVKSLANIFCDTSCLPSEPSLDKKAAGNIESKAALTPPTNNEVPNC